MGRAEEAAPLELRATVIRAKYATNRVFETSDPEP